MSRICFLFNPPKQWEIIENFKQKSDMIRCITLGGEKKADWGKARVTVGDQLGGHIGIKGKKKKTKIAQIRVLVIKSEKSRRIPNIFRSQDLNMEIRKKQN